ncbi:MAG TPA: transposase [Verrucomicrobiae bacterium]
MVQIDHGSDLAYVVRIDRVGALPEARTLSEIETGLKNKTARTLTVDPFAYLQKPEEKIPEKHRRRRDAAWALIKPIFDAPNNAAFDPRARGPLVQAAVERTGSTKKQVYKCLSRYWQGGMTPNALLPLFHFCGKPGPGKTRKIGSAKLGRPRLLPKLKGAHPGINIGPDEADKLKQGYRLFYKKAPEDGGLSLKEAFDKTLQKYFRCGFERRNGVLVPVVPPDDERPTIDQFVYWGRKEEDFKDTQIRRQGKRRFNLRSRAVLGDATLMAFGPGSLFQVDSTPCDVWVVSALDRSRRVGKPILYSVVDTFSHIIAGFHVGLDDSSFFVAGLALQNAMVDKVAYCAEFGITIASEEWPNFGLPEAVLADRGELEGYGATNLVNSLGIRVDNTSPYRADLKPIVERTFRSLNDLLIHKLPGAVRKPKERGERDPRLDAVLTIGELRTLVIHAILQHNGRWIEGYRLQKDMIADQVQPRPERLWDWGIRNRSGHLRSADPDIVRANLLPPGKATVTHRGIKFRGLHYSCDRAIRERWFEKARASGTRQRDVAYDPRIVDVIFLRTPGSGLVEPCHLLETDRRFAGVSWSDVDDFYLSQEEAQAQGKPNDQQSRAKFQAQGEAIVDKAAKQAAVANLGLTKAARLRGVRGNREEERRRDAAEAVNKIGAVASAPLHNGNGENSAPGEGQKSEAYVPPPSPLEMLRKQREARLNAHEQQ